MKLETLTQTFDTQELSLEERYQRLWLVAKELERRAEHLERLEQLMMQGLTITEASNSDRICLTYGPNKMGPWCDTVQEAVELYFQQEGRT
jgi:hypothetical protein